MSKSDRQSFGKGGRTAQECQEAFEAKSERELQNQLYSLLHRRGHRPAMQRMDKKSNVAIGMPDIIFAVNSRACYWEVKLPGRNPTSEQNRMMAELAGEPNKAHVRVIRSYKEGLEDLDSLYRETKNARRMETKLR